MFDRASAKSLILDLLAAAGGRLDGRVRLHKAFYIAHLFYWRKGHGALTDYPVVRLPFGPGIEDAPKLILELEKEGKVRASSKDTGPYKEAVFHLLVDVKLEKKTPRYDAIKKAVEYVKKHTAIELSEETHVFSRTWQDARNGDELNIYLDLLTDEEYERVKSSTRRASEVVGAVFGQAT